MVGLTPAAEPAGIRWYAMNDHTKLSAELADCDGIPLIRVHGEIDLHSAAELDQVVRAGVERGTRALIVDLGDASYLDSAGLSTLLAAHKALSARNASLFVVAPPSQRAVRRVLEITRLEAVFHVRSTVEDVLNEMRSAEAA